MPNEKIYPTSAEHFLIPQIASRILIMLLISMIFTGLLPINGSATCADSFYKFLDQRIDHRGAQNWNGHEYQLLHVSPPATWNEVSYWVLCLSMISGWNNVHLVTISSQAENDFLYQWVSQYPDCWKMGPWHSGIGPWIGLYKENDGYWNWHFSNERVTYTNWEPGEPNNSGDFAAFAGRGPYAPQRTLMGPYWDDIPNGETASSFIIEFDPESS